MAEEKVGASRMLALSTKSKTLGLALILSVVALARGQESRPQAPPRTTPSLYNRLSPSVVSITVSGRDGAPFASGSGVILSTDGVILTNYHVVEGGVFFDIKLPGQGTDERPVPARPFQCAAEQDLATLQIVPVNGLKPVRLAKRIPAVGDHVFAVGSPLGLEGTLSDGIVSQIRKDQGEVFIQTTTPISHGSSGGGLFLGDGSLVGITALSMRGGQGLNFAVSAQSVASLVQCASFPARPAERDEEQEPGSSPPPPPAAARPPCVANPVINKVANSGASHVSLTVAVLQVSGIVLNKGCATAGFVKVRVEVEKFGKFVTSETVFTSDEYIQPGQRSDFKVDIEVPTSLFVGTTSHDISFKVEIANFLSM